MQIKAATLLASQQQIQAQTPIQAQIQAKPAPGFSAALEKVGGFEPLPLKQMTRTDESPAALVPTAAPARLGATLDIKV